MWLAQHGLNNSLIVFIHGIHSDRYRAWENLVDGVQDLLQSTTMPQVRSYDAYAYGYKADPLTAPSLHKGPLAGLTRFFEEHVAGHYHCVVLIGHSQGGLLAESYCLQELRNGRGLELPVQLVLTFNTPHLGSDFGNFGDFLLPGRFLTGREWGAQIRDLAPGSEFLRDLMQGWGECVSRNRNEPPASHRRFIELVCMVGTKDDVVTPESAAGLHATRVFTGHWGHSLDNPDAVRYIEVQLMRHAFPQTLVRQAERIWQSLMDEEQDELFHRYCAEHRHLVFGAIRRMQPALRTASCARLCQQLLVEFVREVRHRPLRKLTWTQALQWYVERKILTM